MQVIDLLILGFNALLAVAMLLLGATLKAVYDAVKELRGGDAGLHERITLLAMSLPETYARRDDMKDIRDTLIRIEAKLDSKADKQQPRQQGDHS